MGPRYPWVVVGLLWFCGFFNYADRQAVFSVFPLLKAEFGLSNEQKGLIGSAFMLVYALSAPLAGFVVDRASRRFLIVVGLAFWSLVCAATALARTFNQLLFFRAAEGLGETFYFPASMSLLADYHGPRTRSRAMSIHQTSVYAGTALGGIAAGYLGANFGWRSPFWVLGLVGLVYAGWLASQIVEPVRSRDDDKPDPGPDLARGDRARGRGARHRPAELRREPDGHLQDAGRGHAAGGLRLRELRGRGLPDMADGLRLHQVRSQHHLFGDRREHLHAGEPGRRPQRGRVRRPRRPVAGGRIRVQALGLFVGAPFIYMVGTASTIPLLIVGMIAVGLCKGFYDANIFASVYDVVPAKMRGTTAGLMNTIGWAFASLGPWAIGRASDRYGLSAAIGSIAGVYVLGGVLALVAASLAARRQAGAR